MAASGRLVNEFRPVDVEPNEIGDATSSWQIRDFLSDHIGKVNLVRDEIGQKLLRYGITIEKANVRKIVAGKNQLDLNGAIVLACVEEIVPVSLYTSMGEWGVMDPKNKVKLSPAARERVFAEIDRRHCLTKYRLDRLYAHSKQQDRTLYRLWWDSYGELLPPPSPAIRGARKWGAHVNADELNSKAFRRATHGQKKSPRSVDYI